MAARLLHRKIMPYSWLQRLPKSGDSSTTGFTILSSSEQCFLVTSSSWATNPAGCPTIANNYLRWNRRSDALWWSAISTIKLSPKRVIRSWAARRLRVAFVKSLNKYGYGSDGFSIDGKRAELPSLNGTVQFFANHPSIIQLKDTDLMKHMDYSVQLLIKKQMGSTKKPGRLDSEKLQSRNRYNNIRKRS
ncbi:hypothetical protein GcM3_108013 [Golovinomyces cichoracearum]|uniref:Uncharacterized protein n=1 Tax=Golovinomyces cichoracearum TaxID=62708 RepID=A0A420I9A8_9PEZI|nr:hypothetical protein GcM3_108013 [Golovinomyces cichoracearum]